MKNIFNLLGNILIFICQSFYDFCGLLWYGKLPKVSIYHTNLRPNSYKRKELHNNPNSQVICVEDVPKEIQKRLINQYIDKLWQNKTFKNNVGIVDVPIFDGKEVVGKTGVYSVLQEELTKF